MSSKYPILPPEKIIKVMKKLEFYKISQKIRARGIKIFRLRAFAPQTAAFKPYAGGRQGVTLCSLQSRICA